MTTETKKNNYVFNTYCSGRDVESKKIYNQILDILKIANYQELKVIHAFLLSFLKIKS